MVENIVSDKPVKKEKAYMDASDKNVNALIVFLNSEDSKYYYDSDFENKVVETETELFFKGAVLNDDGNLYKAVAVESDAIVWYSAT